MEAWRDLCYVGEWKQLSSCIFVFFKRRVVDECDAGEEDA